MTDDSTNSNKTISIQNNNNITLHTSSPNNTSAQHNLYYTSLQHNIYYKTVQQYYNKVLKCVESTSDKCDMLLQDNILYNCNTHIQNKTQNDITIDNNNFNKHLCDALQHDNVQNDNDNNTNVKDKPMTCSDNDSGESVMFIDTQDKQQTL